MDPSPPPWPQRLLNAIPPMSDGVWLGFFLLITFLLGIAVGMQWCMYTSQQEGQRLSVQHQLDAMDKRLKALEQR